MLLERNEHFNTIFDPNIPLSEFLKENSKKEKSNNNITKLSLMIDYYNTNFIPYNTKKTKLMKKFFQNLFKIISDIDFLPNDFYSFWIEINKENSIVSNPEFCDELIDINGILTYKKKKSNTYNRREKRTNTIPGNLFNYNIYSYSTLNSNPIPLNSDTIKEQRTIDDNNNISNMDFIDENEEENINYITNNKTKEIKYISIDLLIKKISIDKRFEIKENSKRYNMDIINGFIEQFGFFISIEKLIAKITNAIKYYNTKKDNFTPYNLISFLNLIVIKQYYHQIALNQQLKNKLIEIYTELSKNKNIIQNFELTFNSIFTLIESSDEYEILCSFLELIGRPRRKYHSLKNPKPSKKINDKFFSPSSKVINFLEWDADSIAQELTLITQNIFEKIDQNEILSYIYCKDDTKKLRAPNVSKLIERFNNLSYFIIEEILSYDRTGKRAKIIEKFIDVEEKLYKLKNFNDCMNIKSTLNHYIVKTLYKTWEKVDKKHKKIFTTINNIFTFDKNLKIIREQIEHLAITKVAYIPYLGTLLKDLAFNKEGPTYINKDTKLINISKIKEVHEIMRKFFKYKENSLFVQHNIGLDILNELNPKGEKELEVLKDLIEPSFTLTKKKINLKRRTSTDISYEYKSNSILFQKIEISNFRGRSITIDSSKQLGKFDDSYEGVGYNEIIEEGLIRKQTV